MESVSLRLWTQDSSPAHNEKPQRAGYLCREGRVRASGLRPARG